MTRLNAPMHMWSDSEGCAASLEPLPVVSRTSISKCLPYLRRTTLRTVHWGSLLVFFFLLQFLWSRLGSFDSLWKLKQTQKLILFLCLIQWHTVQALAACVLECDTELHSGLEDFSICVGVYRCTEILWSTFNTSFTSCTSCMAAYTTNVRLHVWMGKCFRRLKECHRNTIPFTNFTENCVL